MDVFVCVPINSKQDRAEVSQTLLSSKEENTSGGSLCKGRDFLPLRSLYICDQYRIILNVNCN